MKKYLQLFLTTLYISAFTFGGGYVIVSLMKKKFSDELNLISEEEMLNLVAIAQSSPGAVAVNASLLVGKKIAGWLGAFICVVATIIPPFVIISIISYFYQAFASNLFVSLVLRGMQAGVCAVIIDVCLNLSKNIVVEKKKLPIAMIFIAFIATYFLNVNLIIIIVFCGAIGGISSSIENKKALSAESANNSDFGGAEMSGSRDEHLERQLLSDIASDDLHEMDFERDSQTDKGGES